MRHTPCKSQLAIGEFHWGQVVSVFPALPFDVLRVRPISRINASRGSAIDLYERHLMSDPTGTRRCHLHANQHDPRYPPVIDHNPHDIRGCPRSVRLVGVHDRGSIRVLSLPSLPNVFVRTGRKASRPKHQIALKPVLIRRTDLSCIGSLLLNRFNKYI